MRRPYQKEDGFIFLEKSDSYLGARRRERGGRSLFLERASRFRENFSKSRKGELLCRGEGSRLAGVDILDFKTVVLFPIPHGLQVAANSDPRIERAEVEIEREGNYSRAWFSLVPVGVAGSRPIRAVVGML
jgi:hypothetical protein